METKNFLGLDGLKRFWEKAKTWIVNEITTKIAEIVAEAPEDLNTLKEISDWISTHEGSASAMNSRIVANIKAIEEINSKLSIGGSIFKSLFDIVRPVGDTYVQYPQQANPNELWGAFSTWQVVNYDGAFFRAEGTNANAFIEKTDNLVKQGDAIKTHTTGGMSANATGIFTQNNNGICVSVANSWETPGATSGCVSAQSSATGGGCEIGAGRWIGFLDNVRINVSHTHTYYGGVETRPQNYTIRIWKRTA